MKEKFRLVIETLHAPDKGLQENVSTRRRPYFISFSFFFYVSPANIAVVYGTRYALL